MNKYRSNSNDVSDFNTCNYIVRSFDYKFIDRLYKNNNKLSEDHIIKNNKVHIQMIGKGGQGKVYKIKAIDLVATENELQHNDSCNTKKCGYIVIKIVKKNPKVNNNELKIISYCKDIIDKHISPNFLYFYGVNSIANYNIIMSEYADGNLEDWLKTFHSYSEWRSFLFQFLIGVLCVQTKLKAYHSDLKPKNIFYKKLANRTLSFDYEIIDGGKREYIVPTYGYLYVLADFGRVQSLLLKHNKLNENSIKLYISNNIDLEHIIDLPKRIMVNTLEKIYSLDDLLRIIKLRDDIYFDNYFKNKRKEIDKDLSKYPDIVKNKMLYRSVAYYVVEKQYIDPNEIPDNLMIMKFPPSEIVLQLEEWHNKSILKILDTFTEFVIKPDKVPKIIEYDSEHLVKFTLSTTEKDM